MALPDISTNLKPIIYLVGCDFCCGEKVRAPQSPSWFNGCCSHSMVRKWHYLGVDYVHFVIKEEMKNKLDQTIQTVAFVNNDDKLTSYSWCFCWQVNSWVSKTLFGWHVLSQTIQVKGTTRPKRKRCPMEITCEEGGFSQSHFFFVSAQEEEGRGTKNGNGWSRDEKLQVINLKWSNQKHAFFVYAPIEVVVREV